MTPSDVCFGAILVLVWGMNYGPRDQLAAHALMLGKQSLGQSTHRGNRVVGGSKKGESGGRGQ